MLKRSVLRAGYADIALLIQEAAEALSSQDVRGTLADAIRDLANHTGSWTYYVDHTGDGESGDVYYSCGGDVMCAPYEITKAGDTAAKATINTDQAIAVVPRTIYEPEAEEADHYALMEESFKTSKLYTALPIYERFISKAERDAADGEDFAGKGKSFPILKPEDVSAAAKSLGRAGSDNSSVATIKAKIISIAKRKGWTKYLPKAWQGSGEKESATRPTPAGIRLNELMQGSGFLEALPLWEAARSSYPILMISPGEGSSAIYTPEVLKKAAENGVFKKGAFMYWNHPTAAQEAARPEGDLDNLAAITTTDGVYQENGPKGPGVYATAKPMADYADKIEARAPHIGVSIRAGGTSSGVSVNGKPKLASIDYLESVDYVTRAGRGGMALAESEKFTRLLESFNSTEGEIKDMDATKLQEAIDKQAGLIGTQAALIERLTKRALRGDAMELGAAFLRSTSLNEVAKLHVLENVLGSADAPRGIPMNAAGAIDGAKLTEAFTAEAKRVGTLAAALSGSGNVFNMGPAALPVQESADAIKTRELREADHARQAEDAFTRLMGDAKIGKVAATGRAA